MPSILFDNNHIELWELKAHSGLIQEILSGTLRYPQIKKLQGARYQGNPVYRAKIDVKNRLIFTYVTCQGQKNLLVLAVNNHNYNKLKRQFRAPNTAQLDTFTLETETESPETTPIKEPLTFIPAVAYKQKTLILDEEQQKSQQCTMPLLLSGPPGAGKTVLLYQFMIRNQNFDVYDNSNSVTKPTLFLSPSSHLITTLKAEYLSTQPDPNNPVIFSTWNNLLQTHYPNKQPVNEARFVEWLKERGLTDSPKVIHYELSLIAALDEKKYLNQGKRQCYFFGSPAKQNQLINLLKSWQKFLDSENLFDPMVTTLPKELGQYYKIIYCDETQNLPPIALQSLMSSVQEQQFVASIDSEQCLISSPFIHNCLKELLHQHYGHYTEESLLRTWRCPPNIIKTANHLMKAKYSMDGSGLRRPYRDICSTQPEGGLISWIDKKHLEKLKIYGASAGTVVIAEQITEEERLFINEHLGTNNILKAEEAIGLDFDNVILWNPFQQLSLQQLQNKDALDPLSLEQSNALNALYVSLTRAQKNVFIHEQDLKHWNKLAIRLLGELPVNQTPEQQNNNNNNDLKDESQLWLDQIEYHLQEGRVQQARAIMGFHLKMSALDIENKIKTHNLPKENPPTTTPVKENPPKTTSANENSQTTSSKTMEPTSERVIQPISSNTKKVEQPKKLTKTTPNLINNELNELKVLVQAIQRGDKSAFKRLLEHPKAEQFLFHTEPKKIFAWLTGTTTIVAWLLNNHQIDLLTSLKNILSNLQKNKSTKGKTISPILSMLCKPTNTAPSFLLSGLLKKISDDKKIILFIKQHIDPQTLSACLNKAETAELSIVHWAAVKGHNNLLKVLKTLGADMNLSCENGPTPSCMAAEENKAETLKVLYDLGADFKLGNRSGTAPIHAAASRGHIASINMLSICKADLDQPNENGSTAIFLAAMNEEIEAIRILKKLGGDVNKANNKGITPVWFAAQNGKTEVIKALQELDADLEKPNLKGVTPALIATNEGNENVLRLLHQFGVNLKTTTPQGVGVVHVAVEQGHMGLIPVLHELGLSLNVREENGKTPLYIAAEKNQFHTIEPLQKLGADLDISDINGITPVWIAAQNDHFESLRIFIKLGANINTANTSGATPVWAAAKENSMASLEILHSHGANLETPNNEGVTPLFIAAQNGHSKIVKFLLEHTSTAYVPARISKVNLLLVAQESSPAALERANQIIQLKTQGNPEIEIFELTPYEIACIMGHEKVANLLVPNSQIKQETSSVTKIGFFSPHSLPTPNVSIDPPEPPMPQ